MIRPAVIGVLGGTFDPVHSGHVHIAERAAAILELETVLLVPSRIPPHKIVRRITAGRHRIAMLRLAVEGRPGLAVSTLEYDRKGVSYTIDTLRAIREGPPRVEPVFIVGGDALAEIHTWKDYRSILDEVDIVAIRRPDDPGCGTGATPDPEVRRRIVDLVPGRNPPVPPPGAGGRIFRLPVPPVAVSSTAVRTAVAEGKPVRGLVPDSVAKYIQDHHLYRREDPS